MAKRGQNPNNGIGDSKKSPEQKEKPKLQDETAYPSHDEFHVKDHSTEIFRVVPYNHEDGLCCGTEGREEEKMTENPSKEEGTPTTPTKSSGTPAEEMETKSEVQEPEDSDLSKDAERPSSTNTDKQDAINQDEPSTSIALEEFPSAPKTDDQLREDGTSALFENEENENVDRENQEEDNSDQDENDGEEEVWELKKILTVKDLRKKKPTICRTDGCTSQAAVVYVSNLSPTDIWPLCLDCQQKDFEGWPDIDELPIKTMSEEHTTLMRAKCSKDGDRVKMPWGAQRSADNLEQPKNSQQQQEEEECKEEWELKKIMSIEELRELPIVCRTDGCKLQAAVLYVSTSKPDEKWYICVDCQEKDFGGWPSPEEQTIDPMSEEHMKLMRQKCSKKQIVSMPVFQIHHKTAGNADAHPVTPVPHQSQTLKTSSAANAVTLETKSKNVAAKPSKAMVEMHRKWQEQAEKMGGKDARVVVNKPEAKKLIFDLLHDQFRPMTITEIHAELKAVVPSPVLRSCLDEMALESPGENGFADSDDEDGDNKKQSPSSESDSHPYTGSLCFKGGRTPSLALYYVDHNKLENKGNGLVGEEKNNLYANLARAQGQNAQLEASIKSAKAMTSKLLSEPTNAEVTVRLEKEEADYEVLQQQLEAARGLKANEKTKQQLKRRIAHMANQWNSRRTACLGCLELLEDTTEGTVSVKACLKGTGQIYIESDDVATQEALDAAKTKNKRKASTALVKHGVKKAKSMGGSSHATMGYPQALASFVAIRVDKQGRVTRVLLDCENGDT